MERPWVQRSAAAPATNGEAKEVPEPGGVAPVALTGGTEDIDPGATTSSWVPMLENQALLSNSSVATAITASKAAGYGTEFPLLPAAATKTAPLAQA